MSRIMIDEAGILLAQRHQRDRQTLPELPARFEDPVVAAQAVAAALKRDHSIGVAALRDGRLIGYLIGDLVIDATWGRSAWVRMAGWALAPGEDVETTRDLYAKLGARWVAMGCFFHFVQVPTTDQRLIQTWFSLSFGIEQVHALLDLQDLGVSTPTKSASVEIRQAKAGDEPILADMSEIIWRHQVGPPVWGISLPEQNARIRSAYSGMIDDPNATVWLAFDKGQALGFQAYFPGDPSNADLLTPENCVELAVAGTYPSARGRGIGRALTQHGLVHARDQGYRMCLADWRSTSLLASRFWPRQGFRPMMYRLVRRIDHRISWAHGVPQEIPS